MSLISLKGITKNFTGTPVLNNLDLSIAKGEKIGVVGINGTGKSTLLKIIAGEINPDSGELIFFGDKSIRYLTQNYNIDHDLTIIEQVFATDDKDILLIKEYEILLKRIENGEDLTKELLRMQDVIDKKELWDLESKVKTILSKLGVRDYFQNVSQLSGGERKRIFLASALLSPCDLLILDEPTNHLDTDTIDWLQRFLSNSKQALLMVTHDRYFLDKITNSIVEIDSGSIFKYQGNYSYYLEQKALREEVEENRQAKLKNIYRSELKWIRAGVQARSTKQRARIQRFENIEESLKNLSKEKLELALIAKRIGNTTIEISNISKSYDDKKLITDFSYKVEKSDAIGIVGKNGAGKSTLLKMITGLIEPDSGQIKVGETIEFGYFTQETDDMDPEMRMIDYLKEVGEFITLSNGNSLSASNLLERFLFKKSSHYTPIKKLSGGERRRLLLCRVLMKSPNVLILDEPTNDFDTFTLQVVEDFLDTYNGIIITVSHDRYFLNKVCNKIFSFEDGEVKVYDGNYDDFNEKKVQTKKVTVKKVKEKPVKNTNKLTFTERKELETIEDEIFELEESLEEIKAELTTLYADYEKAKPLINKQEQLESDIENKYQRLEYLLEKEQ